MRRSNAPRYSSQWQGSAGSTSGVEVLAPDHGAGEQVFHGGVAQAAQVDLAFGITGKAQRATLLKQGLVTHFKQGGVRGPPARLGWSGNYGRAVRR